MNGQVATQTPAGKFQLTKSPAQREVRIIGKRADGAVEIDDEARDGRRPLLLRVSLLCAAEDPGEHAENGDRSQRSQRSVIVPARWR